VGQAAPVRPGQRHRLPVLPPGADHRTGDRERQAPAWRSWSRSSSGPQVDFLANPDKTNAFIIGTVKQYNTNWTYSTGLANYAIDKMRQDFVNNGSDQTLGNFEVDRVQRLIDIVTPILVGQRQQTKEGLRPKDLYTNEFIDPSIGVAS
jgi:hypothetical protein